MGTETLDNSKLQPLLEAQDWRGLARVLQERHPVEIAGILQERCRDAMAKVILHLERSKAADVLEFLPDDLAALAVHELLDTDPAFTVRVVRAMRTDEGIDVLQDIPAGDRKAILASLTPRDLQRVSELLSYPEDSAGGLMQTELITVPLEARTSEVIDELRSKAVRYADYPATYLYVVDSEQCLVGTVSPRVILLSDAQKPIREIMTPDPVTVVATAPAEEVVRLFREYNYLVMPVVNDSGRLLGVVRHNAVLDFAEEQADEELLEMSGIIGGEEFRDAPVMQRSGRRLSWLSVNIVLNLIAASVIVRYTEVIEAVVALAVFLPIISDMAGNAGHQAIAVSIRELSLGRTHPKDFLKVLWQEAAVGLINGPVLGVIIGIVCWFMYKTAVLGVIVGVALFLNTLIAVVLGSLVPLGLRGLGKDPALASGAILTTVTDLCGFWLLLSMAALAIRSFGLVG